jgi:aminoglycoside N3'-acetyltransferase
LLELHIKGYEHLRDVDGWVLLLGVGIDRCSSLHLGERVPISEDVRDRLKKHQPQSSDFDEIKKQYPADIFLGRSERIACPGPWEIVRDQADRRGMIRRGTIGSAACMLFKAKQVVGLYEDLRRNDPMSLWPLKLTEKEEKGTIA